MTLPFLDRRLELDRLRRSLDARDGGLVCIYGRRRLGKSRLLLEALAGRPAVYYVGDLRDAALQRVALAREVAGLLPGFDRVRYEGWESLLERFWGEAPAGVVLALDELPELVAVAPELPGLLQKRLDRPAAKARHVVLCGSSQRMMHGLVLDASAPLFGRAREILRIRPLGARWISKALGVRSARAAVEHYALWGGVPRYWDLARACRGRRRAVQSLVLDPLGPLHREPDRLLRDELQEVVRAASILALAGQGCRRTSEIASRLAVPATSLSRPLALLVDLGLLQREVPFGASPRDSKRSLYRVAEPFLRFWYRFVEPNRSRLEARMVPQVAAQVERFWPEHVGEIWEELARRSVPRLRLGGSRWDVASRWWGHDRAGGDVELDLVAQSLDDPRHFLAGEVKLSCSTARARAILASLAQKAARCPALAGAERVTSALWVLSPRGAMPTGRVVTARAVLRVLD
jgi:uncharacterized protein